MNNTQFSPGEVVYHWDLFCGWEKLTVERDKGDTVLLSDADGLFDAEREFVHRTPDNSLLPQLTFAPKTN